MEVEAADLKMPSPESSTKRIVVLLQSGIHQIAGLIQGQAPALIHTPNEAGDTLICLGLLKVTPRMILYKEVQEPPRGRFNDTFDPAQM